LLVEHTSIAGGDIGIAKAQIEKIRIIDPKVGLEAEINYELSQNNDVLVIKLLQQTKQTYNDIPDFFFQSGMFQQQNKIIKLPLKNFQRLSVEMLRLM
jgi:hypothetical protein